jgi:hypothetical protein
MSSLEYSRSGAGASLVLLHGIGLLLPRQSRHLDQLPAGTQAETLPGCGHVPMADDPAAVAALITRTVAQAGLAPTMR